ncbi:MAG: hypothetical protein U0K81_06070 [Paludibacteraceae bacterium]|nr:hypothetical protein [Paludibacteraceae bacterium]
MRGWIALHRQFTQWEWFGKPEMVQLFIYLLISATHEDTQWRGMTIKRGQIATSLEKIAFATSLSVRTIRTCLNRLKTTNEITVEATNKQTLITICNYDKYQGIDADSDKRNDKQSDMPTDKQTTSKRQANDKQTTNPIYNNNNNNNNNNNKISLCEARASAREGERDTVFKIFFLKNFTDPHGEVQRFYDNYEAQGWRRGNGQEITDVLAVARTWEPKEKEKRRFPEPFIEALREIDKGFAERGWDSLPMLLDIEKIDFTADSVVIYCGLQAYEAIETTGAVELIRAKVNRNINYRVKRTN